MATTDSSDGPETSGTDADVASLLSAVTTALGDRLPELSRSMHEEMAREISELDGDALMLDLLRASSESNVETFFHLSRYGIPVDGIEAPPAAVEYARRLAQRGISSHALQRAYRLGHRHVLAVAHDEIIARAVEPAVAIGALRALSDQAFAYVDAVSEKVIDAYETERARWVASRTTLVAHTIEALLSRTGTDVEAAEQALGHRLRQRHLGVVAWSLGSSASLPVMPQLELAVTDLAHRLGVGAPLFVPQDHGVAWAWLPCGASSPALDDVLSSSPVADDVRLALGSPSRDVDGFVATHREAVRAHLVATVAGDRARPVTGWTSPGLRSASLLARDLSAAKELVVAALGPLARDDEPMQRLRTTLRVFLEQRRSFVATAEVLHLHRNTVKYRVDRAAALRGRALDEDRVELELALVACHWLGAGVLDT